MRAQIIDISIHKYKIQLNMFTSTVDIKQVFINYSEKNLKNLYKNNSQQRF